MAQEDDDIVSDSADGTIEYIEERNYLLKDIPYTTVRRAWFTLSHLLLDDGARVLDMGCGDGILTYTMAALNPKVRFIGIDKSKRIINKARETYKLHNLEFQIGDVSSDLFEPQSIDCILNNYILHRVFSDSRYNEQIVSDTLRKQFAMLKDDGIMYIRDYAKPPHDQYVLMEMHDDESESEELADLSEADLLVWYSEHARPKQDPGCGGFFLEELEPRFPKTRLFRLPYKWAYEFIMRKDNRDLWNDELPFEYTFFTVDEFRQELKSLGARVEYSAPHWDEDYIRQNFLGHFRLLHTNGETLGDPATSFISVSKKEPERTSLRIMERRISSEDSHLKIRTLRDEHSGKAVDVVTRDEEISEMLPYLTDEDGRLYVYLHDGIARGLVNAVSRAGSNIDEREWSGHMVEPIALDYEKVTDLGDFDKENSADFAKTYLGLEAEDDAVIEAGPNYYPEPNYIDERVHTHYLHVKDAEKNIKVKSKILRNHQFHAKGVIRKFNAQTILDAIAVGLIPNARLELQILSLMQHLDIKAENWISKDISIVAGTLDDKAFKIREFLRQVSNSDKRFKEVKNPVGDLRAINSIFVEEGHSQGGYTGLSSENLDFVISNDKTINTAVVIPLTKSAKGDIHAGFLIKHMPVPERYEANGLTVSAPQFNIPKEIINYRMLKQFIAEKFGVTPDMVIKLGESYHTHIGMTPQRIHPFAIAAPPKTFRDPDTKFIPIYQYMLLWKSLSKETHFMATLARAYRYLPAHIKTQAKLDVKHILEEKFKSAQPDWSLPVTAQPTEKLLGHSPEARLLPDAKDKDKKDGKSGDKDLKPSSDFLNSDPDKKKKEKKRRRKRGETLDAKTNARTKAKTKATTDATEAPDDDEDDENETKLDLVEEFEREIDAIRDLIDDDDNGPKNEL